MYTVINDRMCDQTSNNSCNGAVCIRIYGKRPAVNGKKQNLRISKTVEEEGGDVVIKHLNKVKTRDILML